MILLALRFPDGFSTYPQVFHPKWKRRPAHQHIALHWRVFRYTNLLWRIFTKNLSPLEIHGLSHDVRDQTEKGSNEVNKFLLCGFVSKEGQEKKHFLRPTVEGSGLQVLPIDFSLFKYCSLVFAILKSHFEFELDPSSVFVEQLMLWICCDFKDSRFSKQQVYSRLIWVSLKETNFFSSVFHQNYLLNVKRKIWLVLY